MIQRIKHRYSLLMVCVVALCVSIHKNAFGISCDMSLVGFLLMIVTKVFNNIAVSCSLWGMFTILSSCQLQPANEWMRASVTVISLNIPFDASSSRKLLNKMFEVSACVIMIYNSLELMQNLLVKIKFLK